MLLNLYDKNKEIANLEKHACKNRILIETSNSNIIFHIKKKVINGLRQPPVTLLPLLLPV